MEALYYPNFFPPEKWLRSNLLFFDSIQTIIPMDVKYKRPPNISHFINQNPKTLHSIPLEDRDKIHDSDRLTQIEAAFQIISSNNQNRKNKYKFFPEEERFCSHSYLDETKLSYEIYRLLRKYQLIFVNSEDVDKHNLGPKNFEGNFLIMDSEAANIIMSYIADNIGYRKGIPTITDNNLNFIFNSLDDFEYKMNLEPESILANSIVQCSIPKDIQNISLSQYSDIRDNFVGVREKFPELLEEIIKRKRLDRIHDKHFLIDKISGIKSEFDLEVQEANRLCVKQGIKEWGPFTVGSMISLGAAIFNCPEIVIPSAVSTISFKVIQMHYDRKKVNDGKKPILKLIGKMQKEIIRAKIVKEYLESENKIYTRNFT
jgi:hypothetical protein